MHSPKCPYEVNTYLEEADSNRKFHDLKQMDEHQLAEWADAFCADVANIWDHHGVPVVGGQSEDDIIEDFKRLLNADPKLMERMDEQTGRSNCIENTFGFGATCNQFFPTILKTKDITSNSMDGPSIYGYFAEEKRRPQFLNAMRKLLQLDPMHSYSSPVKGYDDLSTWRADNPDISDNHFWLRPRKKPKPGLLTLGDGQVEQLMSTTQLKDQHVPVRQPFYSVHVYDPNSRIMDFPKLWRVLFDGTPATNFPPLVAKYLYEKYATPKNPGEPAIVYDPCAGWGGRILGAMATVGQHPIHYIGTDPNPDHYMPETQQTKYEYLAGYFLANVRPKTKNTYDIFTEGAEDIRSDPEFQEYRGKVDFVFTSPPYFAAEGYSDDASQSHIKFPTYEAWLDGFLKPLIRTAEEWLRLGGFFCLNIADVRINKKLLPLQADATKMMFDAGFAQHPEIRMLLKDAPQGSKQTDQGVPTTRNYCKVQGKTRKYEPILVFQKVIDDDTDWEKTSSLRQQSR